MHMLTYFKSSQVFANVRLSVKKVNRLREDEHMSSMKIVKFFGPPTSLVHVSQKFSHPLDAERPISYEGNNNHTVYVKKQNQNKNKTKSRHIKIDHPCYCSIKPTNYAMVSLKDGFPVWSW